jgi:Ankyrin repeats (many copies)
MTSKDNSRDEELLARYRQAGETDAAAPSEAVRSAILAESRRAAEQLAKKAPQHPVDVSRPAANDSRWKIPAFGTVGAALLAALLFAPRYWENAPPAQVSMAPAPASAAQAKLEGAQLEELKSYAAPSNSAPARQSPSESNSLQETIVAQGGRRSSKSAGAPSLTPPVPAPAPPPGAAQNYAPVSPSFAPLAAAPPLPAARARPPDLSARAAASGALSASADRAARADGALKPATLQSAVAQGDLAQTALLLDRGAVIDARDDAGRTPLMLAVTEDRAEVVRLLLARGADPNAADNAGHTPLQQATKRNLQDVAALLEQAGAH